MDREIPPPLALTLLILLRRAGWNQEELAAALPKKPETVSTWIRTGQGLTRKKLEKATLRIGFEVSEIDRTLNYLAGKRPGEDEEIPGLTDLTPDERRMVREVRARVVRNALNVLDARLPWLIEQQRLARARAEAEAWWQALRSIPLEQQRDWIDQTPGCHTPALVALVCDESRKAANASADRALALARLALYIAERVPGEVSDGCQGYSWALIANAHRVGGKLRAGGEAFAKAHELWDNSITDPALYPTRFLSLEASFYCDQRRYEEALSLVDQALISADPRETVNLLLQKSHIQHCDGHYDEAIRTLRIAESLVDPVADSRSWYAVQFDLAANYCRLGHYEEARAFLPAIENLAETLHRDLGLIRLLWLRALTAAGLGGEEDAVRWLEQVRQFFVERKNPFNAAIASLDLAELYLKQGRWPDVRLLAEEMICVFERKGVQGEALKALHLFLEAARREEATVVWLRRLARYLREARHDPSYRFKK